jgi:hypothetical protein
MCLATCIFTTSLPSQAAQPAGLPALAERVTALEALVAAQANQIAALQAQLNTIQPQFSQPEVSALRGIVGTFTVAETNIHIAGNICVSGDVSVRQGHTLFASHVQPSDGLCGGDTAGVTIFDGNVGIQATNTLFVNNLRAFQAIPPSPAESQELGVALGPFVQITGNGGNTVISYGPILFRSLP